jgi:signal transduction histidine kinase
MSLRSLISLDASLQGRRWRIPIVLPALAASLLVVMLAFQAAVAVRVHRAAVEKTLSDYAAFTTWQYARRASDYLRLSIVLAIQSSAERREGAACRVPDIHAGRVVLLSNGTGVPNETVLAALEQALERMGRSRVQIGLITVGDPARHQRLGYWFTSETSSRPWRCQAVLVTDRQLVEIANHVAAFAPLLPPALVRGVDRDSLFAIQLLSPERSRIATIGGYFTGIAATDTLGPDLGGLLVSATLHPAAVERLVAGGVPRSNLPMLLTMVVVTLALCVIAGWQLQRSQQIIQLRSDFVTSISHELKTPLTQISLFADTLASPRERTAAERRQYLNIISRESRRLGQLVDSILHFAGMLRSEASATPRENVLLGDEIREAVAAFAPIAAARAVTIHTQIDDEIDLPLERDAFRQLLLNVLDNALKYGPDTQQITVTAGMHRDCARVWVDDAGPGVHRAERERVFEPFVRADRGASRGGSGIGLAVVRDIVRRHRGRVRIMESPAGGARVEIELPDASSVDAHAMHAED